MDITWEAFSDELEKLGVTPSWVLGRAIKGMKSRNTLAKTLKGPQREALNRQTSEQLGRIATRGKSDLRQLKSPDQLLNELKARQEILRGELPYSPTIAAGPPSPIQRAHRGVMENPRSATGTLLTTRITPDSNRWSRPRDEVGRRAEHYGNLVVSPMSGEAPLARGWRSVSKALGEVAKDPKDSFGMFGKLRGPLAEDFVGSASTRLARGKRFAPSESARRRALSEAEIGSPGGLSLVAPDARGGLSLAGPSKRGGLSLDDPSSRGGLTVTSSAFNDELRKLSGDGGLITPGGPYGTFARMGITKVPAKDVSVGPSGNVIVAGGPTGKFEHRPSPFPTENAITRAGDRLGEIGEAFIERMKTAPPAPAPVAIAQSTQK